MNSLEFKLSSFFILLMLAFFVNHYAEASLSNNEPGKRMKYLQTGLFGKLADVDDLGPKVQEGFEKVHKANEAYDFTGKATDGVDDDCSSEFCTKFLNHPERLPRCAGCAVKTLTHPLDALKDDDP